MDADNVALRDPTSLFDWPPYTRAVRPPPPPAAPPPTPSQGLLLWPDFWPPSAAPDALRVAPEAARALAAGANASDESGQLVAHKARAWRPLLLALFVNLQAPLYYRLLSNYMGTGDKESWRFAAGMAGGEAPARGARGPASAGVRGARHREQLLSNTMVRGGGGRSAWSAPGLTRRRGCLRCSTTRTTGGPSSRTPTCTSGACRTRPARRRATLADGRW